MVVLTYGNFNPSRYNKHKLQVFYMEFLFDNRLCKNRQSMNGEKMVELRNEIYEEILRYKTQETNYFPKPIDLMKYREDHVKQAA